MNTGLPRRLTAAIRAKAMAEGLSMDDLRASVAQQIARSPSALRSYEKGRREPSLGSISSIALALDCSPAWLAFGDDEGRMGKREVSSVTLGPAFGGLTDVERYALERVAAAMLRPPDE